MGIFYFLIAICACTVGALTGMGGGVLMKPVMDALGQFDVATINMLSAITVLCMSVVSVFRQIKSPNKPTGKITVSLALGAILGGNLGNALLQRLIQNINSRAVTLIQNVALSILIVLVILYMEHKAKLPSPKWDGVLSGILVGLTLGFFSSFLGIGGGPINVAMIIFCFGYTTKQATLCSLITILFSQAAKLIPAVITGQIAQYDLHVLPFLIAGAVAGGLLGAYINKSISEQQTDKLFQAAQIIILILCGVNILRSL